ncbi:glycosyltransferase domain-containing protein [Cloacibacterium sp.]|uniref:glycosyltransferase domain-containing protein n=1 Tax=Cloacibacterium sp. TaxID=1913682 RepID=UPI0039E3FBA0
MKKIVVYTAIFGDYSALIEQPKFENVDYVCFSDKFIESKSWKIIVVKDFPMGDDNTRNNRYYKILPHIQFDDYEYSVYIDGNFLLKKNPNVLVEDFLKNNYSMACFDHNQTVLDKRNCIYKEYEAILELGNKNGNYKDSLETMKNYIDFIKSEKYPEENGLIKGSVLVRKHHESGLVKIMEEWWYFVKNHSRRYQLSFNYVAWKNNFKYNTIPGDIRRKNKYVYYLGKHKQNINFDLLKYKIRKIFFLD